MITAEIHPTAPNRITVQTSWTDAERIKLIPGTRWNHHNKVWELPLSWGACVQLRGVFDTDLQVGPELTKWSWHEFTTRVEPAMDLREKLNDDEYVAEDFGRLYPFQRVGSVMMADVAGDMLLSDELGLGKTITTLAALSRSVGLPALVICPNSVKRGWENAVRDWYPGATSYVLMGGAQGRRKLLAQAREDPTAIVITNIESVRGFSRLAPFGNVALKKCRECDPEHGEEKLTSSRCEAHTKELNGFGFKTVIVDEAHRIKEPRAAQTRACWAVGHDPSVRRRWALTGTPIGNNIGDLWSIMHFVAPYEWPTKSKWVDRYALTSWNQFGGLDIIGLNPATRAEFQRIFHPRFRRTPKALVLEQLPDVVRTTRWVELSPKQEKAYREMEKDLVTVLDDGQILVSPNNLQKRLRLLQLSSSYCEIIEEPQPLQANSKCREREPNSILPPCGPTEHHPRCPNRIKLRVLLAEPSPKLDALDDVIIESGGKPLVVAAMSRQLIELAAKRLEAHKITHGLITGKYSEYERMQAIKRFNQDEIQIILMTLSAGGTGVDGLQRSDTLVNLQRSWSMIDNVQGDGRVNRIGSERHESINIIDIVAQNTVEETVLMPRLAEKFRQLDEINRDRARLLAAGKNTTELFALEQRESMIMGSDLGVPSRVGENG